DGEEVDLCFGAVADCHREFDGRVGPGLEGDPRKPYVAEPVDLIEEAFPGDEAQAGVPLKLLHRTVGKGFLHLAGPRVREDDIAAIFELVCPGEAVNLDLAADALCALTPLQFDRLEVVL